MKNEQKWYKNQVIIAALIILFFPLGIFLMWKNTSWNSKLKWGITGIFALFMATSIFRGATAQPPILTLQIGPTTVQTQTHTIKGTVTPSDSELKINNQLISVQSDGSFQSEVKLIEGSNEIKVHADNYGKIAETSEIIVRELTNQEKQEKIKAEENQKLADTKTSTSKKELPKVNFTGKIEPQIAHVGQKVVISVEVENLSDTTTIDDLRLLFSDKEFLTKGLVIVNAMSGGQQDTDRSFIWQGTPIAEIPPHEKRTYTIVAYANEAGNYNSIIMLKSGSKFNTFSDPSGNEELSAKLSVLPN